MPKTQDPHVEVKEVAGKATGAAVTGPSQADIAASEVFGEEVDQSPLAKIRGAKERIEKSHADAKIAQQEKEELAEVWGKLSQNFANAGALDVVVKIGECAGDLNDLPLVNKILAILEPFENASGNTPTHPPDISKILLDLTTNHDVNAIVSALRRKGVNLQSLVPSLENDEKGVADRLLILGQQKRYDHVIKEEGQLKSRLAQLRSLLLALDPNKFQYRWG